MAQGWWDRMMGFLGFGPEEEDDDVAVAAETDLEPRPVRGRRTGPPAPSAGANVIALGGSRSPTALKVLVISPKAFEDVQGIADQLKGRRPVILNLEHVDKEVAQRILNFLHGAIYALGGDTQKVSSSIFFFAPPGVDVANMGRGLSTSALGGGAYPTEAGALAELGLAELSGSARLPLDDGRGGMFLPTGEARRALSGTQDATKGGSGWRR